jgi:UPF0716 protein FxsA
VRGRLFLLFTLVPLVEIFLLIQFGGLMGVWPTIALVAITGWLGATLARREGRRAIASYQEAMAKGKLPEEGIVSGLLILAGGVLLITPGIISDVCGLLLMIPPIRKRVAKLVQARLQKQITSGNVQVMHIGSAGFGMPGFGGGFGGAQAPTGTVVDAEVVPSKASGSSPTSASGKSLKA